MRRLGALNWKIGGLRRVVALQDAASGHRGGEAFQEFLRRKSSRVGRGKQYPAALQQWHCGGGERAIILFRLENTALLGAGKCRRVENYHVKQTFLSGKSAQPVEHVPENEIVHCQINCVEREVATAPIQVIFRKVQACDPIAGGGRANRKAARV